MRNQTLRERCPLLFAFGNHHKFLSPDEALTATFETRLRSVWAFLVRRVKAFQETLSVREKANFDVEDTLSELVVVLARKDGLWRPDEGRYITFAGVVVKRELCSIRDRSRTVESPRNSTGRLKEYQAELDRGTITPARRECFAAVKRTSAAPMSVSSSSQDGVIDLVDERGAGGRLPYELAEDAIERAFREALDPLEADVLASTAWLFGRRRRSFADIACEHGLTESIIRDARLSALEKIRDYLVSIGHPVLGAIGLDD